MRVDVEPEDAPYCTECGCEDSDFLAFLETYANGDYWECMICGNRFMWASPEQED